MPHETVLVTGVAGFIGAALEGHARAAGARCLGIGRRALSRQDYHAIDLSTGEEALRALLREVRPTVLFHLAGGMVGDPFAAHLPPTRHLLAAVQSICGYQPSIVVVGSAAEYGDLGRTPIDEGARELPVAEYGVAKLAQTRLALLARRAGLHVVVPRLFNVIGPGMPRSLAPQRFAREARAAIAAGRGTIVVGNLGAIRDYLDVQDVARALWALGHGPMPEPVINVCSGRGLAMRDLLVEIMRQLGGELQVRVDAALERGSADVPVSVGNNARVRAATGGSFDIDLERAVRRLLGDGEPVSTPGETR